MACSRHRPAAAWLRWFGSDPHLAGIAAAAISVDLTLTGVIETWLRHNFWPWWLVVIGSSYVTGWSVAVVIIKIARHRPLASIIVPVVEDPDWLHEHGAAITRTLIILLVVAVGTASWIRFGFLGLSAAAVFVAALFGIFIGLRWLADWLREHHAQP